jgi:UDP-N-acetyl-2-amino-2-deoxyglucuronate dehydrogenase
VKNFVLIGAAGYIAPRHMQAIKQTGNNLIAAFDPHDAVGVLDSYFPDCDFFTEFERFDRHCDKLKRQNVKIDFVVVCSPNYLHDAHIRFGLKIGADVICEKPVVLNPWNVDALLEMEKETGRKVLVVHQLRYHPAIVALKEKVEKAGSREKFQIDLKYITPRGRWYQYSWKGDEAKSGGITTNIGLHFFDILLWIFGGLENVSKSTYNSTSASGTLSLQKATVNWFLSINHSQEKNTHTSEKGVPTRQLMIDGEHIDFTGGFENLHIDLYQRILSGGGISLAECKETIQLLYNIRKETVS